MIAVWGAGPVGLFAMASAYLLGAERVNVSDTIDYEEESVLERLKALTGGRGPDATRQADAHARDRPADRAPGGDSGVPERRDTCEKVVLST